MDAIRHTSLAQPQHRTPDCRRVPCTDWGWGTQRKLVRTSWQTHAEERGQELQAGVGQGASVPVTMTQDGPGRKLRVSADPLARLQRAQK